MKDKSNKNINALFESVRELPTELELKKLEEVILNFPDQPVLIIKPKGISNFLKLKYIAMTIITIIAVIAVITFKPAETSTHTDKDLMVPTETSSTLLQEPNSDILPKEKILSDPPTTAPAITPPATIKPPASPPKLSFEKPADKQKIRLNKIEKPVITPIESTTDPAVTVTYIKGQELEIDNNSLPDLSGRKLKKIRRILYRNLLNDGLISFKGMKVELELRSDKIILNDIEIPSKFLIKYHTLTQKVGTGPLRKIKMNSDFILAGDFTAEGFRGSGVGELSQVSLETDKSLSDFFPGAISKAKYKTDFLDIESEALKKFAISIQYATPEFDGKKRMLGVNLKGNEASELHNKLKILLHQDGYINEDQEFAFIQLPEDKIWINGKPISAVDSQKYRSLASKYKIKSGKNRVILFSPHILQAGNFSYGNFTGTIMMKPQRK